MNKSKKILFRVLLILGGIIIIAGASYGVVKANDYWQVKQLVKASDDLANQEKYQEAYDKLNLTQARWTTSKIRQDIETKMGLDKQLTADQSNYATANDLFGQSKWQEAKDSYSKVSDKFNHYKEAQDKVKECQSKIDETNAQQQAEQQNQETVSSQASAKSDPKPTAPDYSQCGDPGPEILPTYSYYTCQHSLYQQYLKDLQAWDTRHGIINTSCRWVGNNWKCTTQ